MSEGEACTLRVVVCGSYGDMRTFTEALNSCKLRHGAQNVFPDEKHLQRSSPCIEAHHVRKEETESTIEARSRLMKVYFEQIDHADLVVIVNEKNGKEYTALGLHWSSDMRLQKARCFILRESRQIRTYSA